MAKDVFVHPNAIVETDHIGGGTRVWGFAHVLHDARIGERCNIGGHSFIEGGSWIGDEVTLKNGNMVWEGVTLEDGVFVGPGVIFTNDLNPRSPRLPQVLERYSDKRWLAQTTVRRGAALGAGAIIIANRVIGEYSMVGAGAVVTRDVLAYALVLGNPARQVGWVCQCGQRLKQSNSSSLTDGKRIECENCQRKYVLHLTGESPTGVLEFVESGAA
jgi:acetyltransferase-like isoleucine patch superfamily enzyme